MNAPSLLGTPLKMFTRLPIGEGPRVAVLKLGTATCRPSHSRSNSRRNLTRAISCLLVAGTPLLRAQVVPPLPPTPPPPAIVADEGELAQELAQVRSQADQIRQKASALAQIAHDPLDMEFHLGPVKSDPRRGQPLIVSTSETDDDNLNEDLTIMSRVFQKTVEQGGGDRNSWAMGIQVFSFGDARAPQSFYIDGYGALFLLKAPFPLTAAKVKEEETKNDKPADNTWEQTKRELYGPRDGSGLRYSKGWSQGGSGVFKSEPQIQYDESRVEKLKRDLLESLKNAANIRALKSDDVVSVAVLGSAAGSGPRLQDRLQKIVTSESGDRKESREAHAVVAVGKSGDRDTARLIVQAKKSDIDAFAKGSLNLEQFTKRAKLRIR